MSVQYKAVEKVGRGAGAVVLTILLVILAFVAPFIALIIIGLMMLDKLNDIYFEVRELRRQNELRAFAESAKAEAASGTQSS